MSRREEDRGHGKREYETDRRDGRDGYERRDDGRDDRGDDRGDFRREENRDDGRGDNDRDDRREGKRTKWTDSNDDFASMAVIDGPINRDL